MELFVPFIIETSGRIGQEGETFLEKLKIIQGQKLILNIILINSKLTLEKSLQEVMLSAF